MKKIGILLFAIFIMSSSFAQSFQVIKLDELEDIMHVNAKDKNLYIINFWATWCGPCIKELPDFEKINKEMKDMGVKVILVSLDFKEDQSKLASFLKRKNIQSEVLLLDETNYDQWIDKVDQNWQGAIPATLFINHKKKSFMAKSLAYKEIKSIIQSFQ